MRFSRREFLVVVPGAGAGLALLALRRSPQSPGGLNSEALRAPVVSFHLDQPYLDLTGLEKPYVPPAGMRSGAPLAALSDEILSRFYGSI